MGREVKRVPLDFNWPTDKVWPGYMLYAGCQGVCDGYREPMCAWCRMDVDTRIDPPEGEGWQIWETVSDGSPVSPVFATREELATWLSRNGAGGIVGPMPYDAALRFVDAGWAPSFISTPQTGLVSGVQYVGEEK